MATIRNATLADLPAIRDLLEAAGLPSEGVEAAIADFYVHESAGALNGAAGVELYGAEGLLRSVAVAADAQRQGIAARLCGRVVAHATEKGCQTLYLLTPDAAAYFERAGFEIASRVTAPQSIRECPEFVSLCPASAVLMRKRLVG
jgi:N-acetylglutamate synthase-like GNAT family acetyltransferase